MTYQVRITRSHRPRLVNTVSLARAVLSLIKSSRRYPQYAVDITIDDFTLLASYSPNRPQAYTWQYTLEQADWQRYIKLKLEETAL